YMVLDQYSEFFIISVLVFVCIVLFVFFFFFFSSRRRHTRSYGDWSSDVCSSDLISGLRLASLNPEIRIVAHALELKAANVRAVLENYDLVIDGTDRLSTRYLINDACVLLGLPLVSAAIHRFEGQVMTYVPGRRPWYWRVFPQAVDGMVANCAEAGVLGVLPGVLGTLQATEAIKL